MAYIEINKENFFKNLDIIAQKTQSKDKIALVLKDNAYGHGLLTMAELARSYGLSKAVVQNAQEAKAIEEYFEYILVLSDTPQEVSEKIRYTINSLESIPLFPQGSKVELKVDTGMHRNGIAPTQMHEAFDAIKKRGLRLEALFSHHRSADELTSEWFWQNRNFETLKEEARRLAAHFGFGKLRFHIDNSASLMRRSHFCEDMARVGIAAYGCLEMPAAFGKESFVPVLSLKAKRIASRRLHKGQRIGYGGAGRVDKETVVSTYDIGYGDGFFRLLSHSYTTPHDTPLIGRISMDNTTFASTQEELLIFDDARDVAKKAGTISYEVLTSLKPELPRKVVSR